MKKILLLLMLAAVFAASCKKKSGNGRCNENIACTENFAFITIRFVDKDGAGVNVKNYSSVNQRTKDTIRTTSAIVSDVMPGTYFVVDDGYTKKLSEEGDDIKVSGTDMVTNQTKTAIVKITGGKCACHINKVSGPDEIQFD